MQARVNSEELYKAVMAKGMNIKEAGKLAGMFAQNFGRFMKYDRNVRIETAAKLREAFGEKVVYMVRESNEMP